MRPKVLQIHEKLEAAGIPVLSVKANADETAFEIEYGKGVTEGQKQAAAAALASFKPRRPRTLTEILTAIDALDNADRQKLFALVAADWLQRNPDMARKFQIAIDGDDEIAERDTVPAA